MRTPTPDVPHIDIFEADYSDSERLADLISVVKGIHINSEESKQGIKDFIFLAHKCSEIYQKFNWGKNYELMLDTCKELELTVATLTKISKT